MPSRGRCSSSHQGSNATQDTARNMRHFVPGVRQSLTQRTLRSPGENTGVRPPRPSYRHARTRTSRGPNSKAPRPAPSIFFSRRLRQTIRCAEASGHRSPRARQHGVRPAPVPRDRARSGCRECPSQGRRARPAARRAGCAPPCAGLGSGSRCGSPDSRLSAPTPGTRSSRPGVRRAVQGASDV